VIRPGTEKSSVTLMIYSLLLPPPAMAIRASFHSPVLAILNVFGGGGDVGSSLGHAIKPRHKINSKKINKLWLRMYHRGGE
jgi:hypothetical protein